MRTDTIAVIPALDCAPTIAEIVMGVRRHLNRVVVVDDGSSDGTAELAREAGATVEILDRNRGKGFALRRGMSKALERDPKAIALLDGDGQHDPDDLPVLLEAWDEGAGELIVGSRLGNREPIPAARYWNNYIGSRILSWMCGQSLQDSQSGYRILSASLVRELGLRSNGYAIESEMLLKAADKGGRIAHVPIRTIYENESSHFQPVRDTLRIALVAARVKLFEMG